jgi:surface protein
MTYTVATGVTAVEVRKASDNTSVSGVTSSISGTTATITVPFTDAVSPLNIVVVALENPGVGRESAASVSQTFNIPQFAAPVKASEPVYTTVSAGSYTAEMTYTVAAGVTAVEVRKASDNTYVSGVSSTNGTTSIIVVPFTDADSPLIIVVVALGNSAGLESAASVSQTLKSPVGFPSVYTSRMNFSVPNGPNGVAVDGSGKIVVSCYFGNQLKVYNNQGSLQANIGSAGSSNGLFNAPSAIAIDKSGNIVVADSGNDRIQMFTIGGTHIRSFGSDGTGDGQFKYPNGIAVNSENHIIVTDSFKQTIPAIQSDLVKIFDNTGTFIRKFGSVGTGNGEFNGVIGVAVDKSDKIYVVDSGNYRVQVFDKYGTYISQKTFDRFPQVVTVDDTGKIFVALDNNVIVVHDSNWNYIDHFGYTGSNEFEFKFITGMTVDASGNLHVSERTNNSVKIIGATPQTFTGQLTEPLLISGPTYQNGNVKCTFEIEREVFGIKLSQYSETNKRWEPLLLVPTVTYDVTTYTTKTLVTVECPITQLQIGVSALATYTKTTSVTSAFFTLYRLSNNTTIRYFGNAAAVTSTPLFIQANFRGYTEWFAVVNQTMKTSIVNFFKGSTADAFFTAPGQSYPITKNNIVTTLMTSLSNLVYVTSFSGDLDSWDTSNVTNMGAMFKGSGNFNSDISKWDTSKVTNMQSMFFDAYYFNQNISGWNVDKVTNPVGWATFRTGSSLTAANTPPKFLT